MTSAPGHCHPACPCQIDTCGQCTLTLFLAAPGSSSCLQELHRKCGLGACRLQRSQSNTYFRHCRHDEHAAEAGAPREGQGPGQCTPRPGAACLRAGLVPAAHVAEPALACQVTTDSILPNHYLPGGAVTAYNTSSHCVPWKLILAVLSSKKAVRRFSDLVAARGRAATATGLAEVLREGSPGLAEPLWDRLPSLQVPVQFIAGQLDAKFVTLAIKMAAATARHKQTSMNRVGTMLSSSKDGMDSAHSADSPASPGKNIDTISGREPIIVEGCGHAVHTERPEALVPIIRSFVVLAESVQAW